MTRLEFADLDSAILHGKIVRSSHEYAYSDVEESQEVALYVVENRGDAALRVLALPPRWMELQTFMEVEVAGAGTVPILPTQEVATLCRVHVKSLVTAPPLRELAHAFLPRPDGVRDVDELRRDVDVVKSSLFRVRAQARGLFRMLEEAGKGRYIPFAVLSTPLPPGAFATVTFRRRRVEPTGLGVLARGVLTGRFRARQEFSIGNDGHSTHVHVRPPPGLEISQPRTPPHWPSVGLSQLRGNAWHLYIRPAEKPKIRHARDTRGVTPRSAGWYGSVDFLVPAAVHLAILFSFLLLTIGATYLTRASTATSGDLFALFGLVGGVILSLLLGRMDNAALFQHVFWHAVGTAALAAAWLLVDDSDGTLRTVLFLVGLGLAGKELVVVGMR